MFFDRILKSVALLCLLPLKEFTSFIYSALLVDVTSQRELRNTRVGLTGMANQAESVLFGSQFICTVFCVWARGKRE